MNFMKLLSQEVVKIQMFTSLDKLIDADLYRGKGTRNLQHMSTFEGSIGLIIMPTS